jgi:hypothetical protein
MVRAPGRWLVAFAIAGTGAVATYSRCPGCIPRDRVNANCQWTGDVAFVLDAREARHRAHLVEDAQLAEELAIRFADAEHGRRFGVEHHGGLLDGGQVRRDCLSRMFTAIENAHGVPAAKVQAARGQRSASYDIAVALLFVPFYLLGAASVARRVNRRFSADTPVIRWFAMGLASVAAALLGAQSFRLWGAIWEVIRVGNGHMTSIRAASYSRWNAEYAGADVVASVLLFWLIVAIRHRTVSNDSSAVDDSAPAGIVLR